MFSGLREYKSTEFHFIFPQQRKINHYKKIRGRERCLVGFHNFHIEFHIDVIEKMAYVWLTYRLVTLSTIFTLQNNMSVRNNHAE